MSSKKKAEITKKGSSRIVTILMPVLAVILFGGGLGYYITQGSIDKKLVKQVIDSWAASLEATTTVGEEKVTFTYDDIVMQGSVMDRYATINRPRFQLHILKEEDEVEEDIAVEEEEAEEGQQNAQEEAEVLPSEPETKIDVITVATESARLYPNGVNLSSAKLELDGPIRFIEENETLMTLSYDVPMIVHVDRLNKQNVTLSRIKAILPETLYVVDDALETPDLTAKQAPGAFAELTIAEGRQPVGGISVHINDHELSAEGAEDTLRLASLRLDIHSEPAEEAGQYKLFSSSSFDGLENSVGMPYGAIAGTANFTYEGALPDASMQEPMQWLSMPWQLALESLRFSIGETKLEIDGSFHTTQQEFIPMGQVKLFVNNVSFIREELRKHGVLDDETDMLVNTLVTKMTGTSLEESQEINLTISRETEQSLQLGKLSFEEAAAIALMPAAGAQMDDSDETLAEEPPIEEMQVEEPQAAPQAAEEIPANE